jgi:hypothetical protein
MPANSNWSRRRARIPRAAQLQAFGRLEESGKTEYG